MMPSLRESATLEQTDKWRKECICSNVYDVNTWLWQFRRGKPRLGGLTIEETSDRQDSARKASDKRRKETRDGSKDDGA